MGLQLYRLIRLNDIYLKEKKPLLVKLSSIQIV